MGSAKRKILRECEKVLGSAGASIATRQAEKLFIDLDKAGKEDILKLADAIAQNAVILVGRPKAGAVKDRLTAIANKM